MLPNNVVSFMKKMVKNVDASQQESMVPTNKLTRLKQTLTTGLQQAQDSVAKFSPKGIHAGVTDTTNRRLSSKESSNEDTGVVADSSLDNNASNHTNSSSALLNTSVGTSSRTCSGPPNRLTSCRVCVRSLSIGNSDVSYRLCSQCNLKVCEDCASYSDLDKDIDKTFWRCSVCRRRNQGGTTTVLTSSGTANTGITRQQPISPIPHRWSEEKPSSLSTSSEDYNKRSKDSEVQTPGSAPVSRRERRSTSGEGSACAKQKHFSALQPSLQVETSRHSQEKNSLHIHNGRRNGSLCRTPGRNTNWLDQPHDMTRSVSASESSPEENCDQQRKMHYDRDNIAGNSASWRNSTEVYSSDSTTRRSSSRRSFQKQIQDQSVYLSADDACLSRWSQQRRYSSESSDASDTSCTSGTPRRPSQEDSEDINGGYGSSLLPSTRRRLSFRSNRTRHLYDPDGNDICDAEDASSGDVTSGNNAMASDVAISRLSRRSCSDIMQLNNSIELVTAAAAVTASNQHGLHSPRGSLYDSGNDERLSSHRKVSTQLSDPPPSLSRSQSPRPSLASSRGGSDRRSIERESIRIVIDDVDCSSNKQMVSTAALTSSSVVVYLHRDPHYKDGHGFTAGFGLSLTARKNVTITRIEPHGPADRVGLRCGDIVLSWDGVELIGRSFEDIKDELQHSGDSIQIKVLRSSHLEDSPKPHQQLEREEPQPIRPNKLTSTVLILEGPSGRSTPPSPTRRRLPQAPTTSMKTGADQPTSIFYRVQLKFKCSLERSGNLCMEITVLGAEKSPVKANHSRDIEDEPDEISFAWIHVVLVLPSGASRKFVTDKVEAIYGLRWNSLFTCSDITHEEISRSQLTLALWTDNFQRGEIKLAESNTELENVAMDGRSVWLPLLHCDTLAFPTPRRLSKALSHDQQSHQQVRNLSISRNSSELSVDHASQSPPSSRQRTPTPPGIGLPRSRSAEICNLLLQPEAPNWATSGLSAPASLAPSRRGSSYNCEDDLLIPQSSPSSRRGSSVFLDETEAANMQLIHEKLPAPCATASHEQQGFPISQRRSQSFRTEIKDRQRNSHGRKPERILNTSALELGAGQILPSQKPTLNKEEGIFYSTESCGQIKLGLIFTQGQLEVEVIAARNLPFVGETRMLPDAYVEVTFCDRERLIRKRKTRTMRQSCNPEFHQTLTFEECDAVGSTLVIEVKLNEDMGNARSLRKSSAVSPTRNVKPLSAQQSQSSLGLVHIALDRLTLKTLIISWYRLIPSFLVNMTDHCNSEDSS